MVKFARKGARINVRAPITTVAGPPLATFEGGPALARDAKSELFLLALTNMVGETAFYESASDRDGRFAALIHTVTSDDPDWMGRFVRWLRTDGQMRSAAIVAAAEFVAAGGRHGRSVIASALMRADEPAEMLAYWRQEHGRAVPQPVKRGVADAATRLFTEYAALKYDGVARAWRLGDVIELVHPKPANDLQSELFRYLLDRRHHPEAVLVPESLTMVARRKALDVLPAEQRRPLLQERGADLLREAGATWEWLGGWLPGGLDAEAWEAAIPSMGYMALLRNLRNFDEAGVSDAVAATVVATLTDAEKVAKSRQFPYRFWSAYRAAPSLRWAAALEVALQHSLHNVPALPGRTLVVTDTSGSMGQAVSRGSKVRHFEIAALFAAAVAAQAEAVDLVAFATDWERVPFGPTQSVLRTVERIEARLGAVGHGTFLGKALTGAFAGHDRVVVFSDLQVADQVPVPPVPTFVFNTGGYRPVPMKVGEKGVYELGGFSDASLRMMALLEGLRDADWPF